MKKQIAILATILAASGFCAFGQDYMSFATASKTVWDNFGGTGSAGDVFAGSGDINAILLWAPVNTPDYMTAVPGTGWGTRGGSSGYPALVDDETGTNATDIERENPVAEIDQMLAGGWSIAVDQGSGTGTAATGTAIATSINPGTLSFNGGSPFQVKDITGPSGSDVEEVIIAYNASAGSYLTAVDFGWSNPFNVSVGTSDTDPNASSQGSTLVNTFGVDTSPEPTTLALAGLGTFSMLLLRRRKV